MILDAKESLRAVKDFVEGISHMVQKKRTDEYDAESQYEVEHHTTASVVPESTSHLHRFRLIACLARGSDMYLALAGYTSSPERDGDLLENKQPSLHRFPLETAP
jgi:hypothetical protein